MMAMAEGLPTKREDARLAPAQRHQHDPPDRAERHDRKGDVGAAVELGRTTLPGVTRRSH